MKKLILTLAILLLAFSAQAWDLKWDDLADEDGYIVKYKEYPTGYSYPGSPAPAAQIIDDTGMTAVNISQDVTEWNLNGSFTPGQRYVFMVKATKDGSESGYSDALCWTYPLPVSVIEVPVDSGANIQINLYKVP